MSSVAREKYLCYLGSPKYHETAFARKYSTGKIYT